MVAPEKQCSARPQVQRRYMIFDRSERPMSSWRIHKGGRVRTREGLTGIGIVYTEDRASWRISMAVLAGLPGSRLSVKLSMLFCLTIGRLYFLEILISSRRCCNSSMFSDPKILTASSDVTGKTSICVIILSPTSNASSTNRVSRSH